MSSYRLTDKAERGLSNIFEYVESRFDFETAVEVLDRIESACQRLSENPDLGHRREDITRHESVRFWPVGPSLIAYQPVADGILVLLIERGERDWRRFFP